MVAWGKGESGLLFFFLRFLFSLFLLFLSSPTSLFLSFYFLFFYPYSVPGSTHFSEPCKQATLK